MKLWTVQEIMTVTGFSESKVRRAIRTGELESRLVGNSRRVLHQWLVKWLQCDPLDPAVAFSVSKMIETADKKITTTAKFHREAEPALFEK